MKLIALILLIATATGTTDWSYNTLTPSENISLVIEVNNLLRTHYFTHAYEENVFDCSDSSIYTYLFLKEAGYHAITIAHQDDMPHPKHMWVAVEAQDGWIFIETTASFGTRLGQVIQGDEIDGYATGITIDDPLLFLTVYNPATTQKRYSLDDDAIGEKF